MSKYAKVTRRNEALAQSVLKRISEGEKPQDALAKSLASFGIKKASYNYYRGILSREFRVKVPKKHGGRPRGLKGPEWCRNIDRDHGLVLAYKSGKTMDELARDYGLTRSRVQQIVAGAGINGYEFRKSWIDPGLRRDAQAGLPVEQIMQKHGVTKKAVLRVYRKLGMPLPRPQFRIDQDLRRKAMIAAYQAGEPVEKIASEYGIMVSTLRARMVEWKARRPKRK